MQYYIDEHDRNQLLRTTGRTGSRFVDRKPVASSPLPTVGKATTAISALQLGTFTLQKNKPTTLADGGTRDAYALCDLASGDLCLLHRVVGEDSGGYWAATKCAGDVSPPPITNAVTCAGCVDGSGPEQWSLQFTGLTLQAGVVDGNADYIALRDYLNNNAITLGNYANCVWSSGPIAIPGADTDVLNISMSLAAGGPSLTLAVEGPSTFARINNTYAKTLTIPYDCESAASHQLTDANPPLTALWFDTPMNATVTPQ